MGARSISKVILVMFLGSGAFERWIMDWNLSFGTQGLAWDVLGGGMLQRIQCTACPNRAVSFAF